MWFPIFYCVADGSAISPVLCGRHTVGSHGVAVDSGLVVAWQTSTARGRPSFGMIEGLRVLVDVGVDAHRLSKLRVLSEDGK